MGTAGHSFVPMLDLFTDEVTSSWDDGGKARIAQYFSPDASVEDLRNALYELFWAFCSDKLDADRVADFITEAKAPFSFVPNCTAHCLCI
jgi:hypothetical protein